MTTSESERISAFDDANQRRTADKRRQKVHTVIGETLAGKRKNGLGYRRPVTALGARSKGRAILPTRPQTPPCPSFAAGHVVVAVWP